MEKICLEFPIINVDRSLNWGNEEYAKEHEFPKDKPFMDMLELVSTLEQDYVIIFCTGRRESVRKKTEEWIDDHFGYDFTYHLFMRPDGDHRHDTEVKPELLANAGVSPKEVLCILEDRDSMVTKWRELGYRCLQVDRGDF